MNGWQTSITYTKKTKSAHKAFHEFMERNGEATEGALWESCGGYPAEGGRGSEKIPAVSQNYSCRTWVSDSVDDRSTTPGKWRDLFLSGKVISFRRYL